MARYIKRPKAKVAREKISHKRRAKSHTNCSKTISGWEKFYYVVSTIGTLVIAISGILLASQFNISKDKQMEIIQATIKDKRELFMEASNLINSRLFDYNRILWTIEGIKKNQDINENLLSKLRILESEYLDTVREYNIDVRKISKQLIYVFNNDVARNFSIENDDVNNPSSIACKFIVLHTKTEKLLKSIFRKKDMNYANQIRALQKERDILFQQISDFLDEVAKLTFDKSKMLYDINNK